MRNGVLDDSKAGANPSGLKLTLFCEGWIFQGLVQGVFGCRRQAEGDAGQRLGRHDRRQRVWNRIRQEARQLASDDRVKRQNLGGIDDTAVTCKKGGFNETASLRYGQLSALFWTTSGGGEL